MDWLTQIKDFTEQLADAADRNDLSAVVPTCPGWTLADLTWHLLEVQDFWTWIISNRPAGPDEYVQPERPSDADLASGLRAGCTALIAALGSAEPADAAWSWTQDHTVGFTYRRQAHEAFVHLADALAVSGDQMPKISAAFGSDGVDEIISNNLQPIPDWGTFTPGHDRLICLQATDTDRSWTFRFGSFGGTSPATGTTYDGEPQVQLGEGKAAAAIITAEAATLDLWLWGRAQTTDLIISGDSSLVADLRQIVAGETQ